MLTNSDLHNYNLGYEMPLGSSGSRLGISYSLMDYSLSGFYNILDAVGRAKTFSIYGSTPFINTSRNYLAAAYGYDNRQLQDELRTFGSSTENTVTPCTWALLATAEVWAVILVTARCIIPAD